MHSKAVFSHDLEINLQRAIALSNASEVVLVTDKNTSKWCKPLLDNISFDLHYEFPVGETHKNLITLEAFLIYLTKNKADRKTILVALGGGMVTDLVGFAASVFKRGIAYINIPTTLLSMVDASVGGKTGIDFNGIKNSVGSFYPPLCILSDAQLLDTLPEKELKSGWAEVIKHLLIMNRPIPLQIPAITNTLLNDWSGIKHNIIRKDPYEKGIRLALNAGHTVGHAIEAYFLQHKKNIPHGYAIAAGLWIEALITSDLLKDDWAFKQMKDGISKVHDKIILTPQDIDPLFELMANDKKNKNGNIVCSLIINEGILTVTEVPKTNITKAIYAYIQA